MHRTFLLLGSLFGALAVALGALGAHKIKEVASADVLAAYHTGVQYQMYHALALLLVGIVYDRISNKWINAAGYLFVCGIIFFSGSLYLITALTIAGKTISPWLGAITPLGGLFFICGWLCFLAGLLRTK